MRFVQTTTSDDIILQGALFESKGKKIIIHIHGMSGNFYENSFIKQMAVDYPKAGIDFLSVETRGSELMRWFYRPDGSTVLLGNAYEIFEDSQKDIQAWLEFTKEYDEIYLQGHSLGCSKIAYFTVNNKSSVKGLILISPADMIGLRIEPNSIKDHEKFLRIANHLIEKGKENELIPEILWDYARLSAKTYMSLFGENAKTSIFNFFKPDLGFDVVKSIKIPVLAIVGTKDDGICTDAKTSMELLKKQNKVIKTEVYDGAPHSFVGFEKKITADVLKFVK